MSLLFKEQIQGVLKEMQPINMITIYYWDKHNDSHMECAL